MKAGELGRSQAARETEAAVQNTEFTWSDVWPRRAPRGVMLPPGQRLVRAFPRFSDRPLAWPPRIPETVELKIGGAVKTSVTLTPNHLAELERVTRRVDFHCVTTWSLLGVEWSGWSFGRLWEEWIVPRAQPDPGARWLVLASNDRRSIILHLDDALAADTLLVDTLEGRPLDDTHGAPLRFISPGQYAYKSVKHLCSIAVHVEQPRGTLGLKEHPRARVALEERHAVVPGWMLRWPYRLVVPLTALLARRAERRRPEA